MTKNSRFRFGIQSVTLALIGLVFLFVYQNCTKTVRKTAQNTSQDLNEDASQAEDSSDTGGDSNGSSTNSASNRSGNSTGNTNSNGPSSIASFSDPKFVAKFEVDHLSASVDDTVIIQLQISDVTFSYVVDWYFSPNATSGTLLQEDLAQDYLKLKNLVLTDNGTYQVKLRATDGSGSVYALNTSFLLAVIAQPDITIQSQPQFVNVQGQALGVSTFPMDSPKLLIQATASSQLALKYQWFEIINGVKVILPSKTQVRLEVVGPGQPGSFTYALEVSNSVTQLLTESIDGSWFQDLWTAKCNNIPVSGTVGTVITYDGTITASATRRISTGNNISLNLTARIQVGGLGYKTCSSSGSGPRIECDSAADSNALWSTRTQVVADSQGIRACATPYFLNASIKPSTQCVSFDCKKAWK